MVVIGFSRSNNFTGWLIRKATGGRYNHVWIGYDEPVWSGRWVTHAIDEGVIPQRAEMLLKKYDESVCFKVDGIDITDGMKKCRDYVNRKYDYKAVILNGLLLLLYRMTGVEWFNPIINQNRISCSEFIALVLQASNYKPVMGKLAELYPPDGPEGLFGVIEKDTQRMHAHDFLKWVRGEKNVQARQAVSKEVHQVE